MDYLVIEGVKPYDGRYELDIREVDRLFTTREWGWIKRLSGYLPLTIGEGLEGVDPELVSVFATIALHRAGKIQAREVPEVFERFGDVEFGGQKIRIEFGELEEEEEEELPPSPSSSENGSISGPASKPSLERWELSPRPTGTLASASLESPPEKSES